MASLFLAVIPKHSVNVPPLSLGFLQASCKAHGVKVQIRDFNFDLWEETIYSEDSYDIWLETNQTLFKGESFKTFCEEVYNDFIQKGIITSTENNILKIKWSDIEKETEYVKFEN